MALTKVSRGLLTTSIVDNGNATAITIDSNENVGIGGVASNSSGYTTLNLNNATNGGLLTFQNNGTAKGYIYNSSSQFRIESATSAPLVFANETGETMRITSAGLVGIGTSTPDTTLHLQTPSGTKSEINFAQTAVTNYRIGVPASTDALVFTYGASTERIRLNSAGNLGINNPNPAQTLSICNPANPNRNGMEIAIGAGDTSSNTIQNYNRATAAYTPLNIVGSILTFGSGGGAVERMRIAADGSISIPNQNAINELSFTGTEFTNIVSATNSGFELGTTGSGYLRFLTNNAERLRINSAGNLLVGTTVATSVSNLQLTSSNSSYGFVDRAQTGIGTPAGFYNQAGAVVGYIGTTSTATSYNTSSDYRLKENVVAITGATERLKQLNPSRFNFIADADITVDGFLAHEVQDVVPEAISGTKDAMRDEEYEVTPAVLDDDGNVTTEAVMGTRSVPDYQGIDQSKLVPLLVATIQELEARLTALENN